MKYEKSHFVRSIGKYPARAYLRLKYRLHSYYSSPTHNFPFYNPLKIWWVNPDDIKAMMEPGYELSRKYNPGVILDGNWDEQTKPFEESIYYESFGMRFLREKEWEETPLYQSAVNRNADNYWHGCSTESEVQEQLSFYTDVFNSIRKNGYLTQRQLQKQELMSQRLVPPEMGEIRVNINREGNVVFEEGRHRFSIAKILNIERIPVIIMGRHKQWIKTGESISELTEINQN